MYNLIAKPLEFFYELYPQLRRRHLAADAVDHDPAAAAHAQGHPQHAGHAEAAARAQEDPGQVQGRSPEAQRRDDGVLQGEQHQPGLGLPAAAAADAGVLHPVPHALRAAEPGALRLRHGRGVGAVRHRRQRRRPAPGIWERFGYFQPNHISHTSQLYIDLSNTRVMESFGHQPRRVGPEGPPRGRRPRRPAVHLAGPGGDGHVVLPAEAGVGPQHRRRRSTRSSRCSCGSCRCSSPSSRSRCPPASSSTSWSPTSSGSASRP